MKFLLESGADPNQIYGENNTSPLNNAFYVGRIDIIRQLIAAESDIDYVNQRGWTSLNYLWDPERPKLAFNTRNPRD